MINGYNSYENSKPIETNINNLSLVDEIAYKIKTLFPLNPKIHKLDKDVNLTMNTEYSIYTNLDDPILFINIPTKNNPYGKMIRIMIYYNKEKDSNLYIQSIKQKSINILEILKDYKYIDHCCIVFVNKEFNPMYYSTNYINENSFLFEKNIIQTTNWINVKTKDLYKYSK